MSLRMSLPHVSAPGAMTLVDLAVVVVLALALLSGWRWGASRYALGLAGSLLGLLAGAWIAQRLLSARLSPVSHVVLGLACVAGGVLVGGAFGSRAGVRLAALLARLHLRVVDRILGAALRGAVALLACWLLAAATVAVGPPGAARAVATSQVLQRVDAALPAPYLVVGRARDLLRRTGPADLTALVPATGTALSPSTTAYADVVRRTRGSVVKVLAAGCATSSEGTGFVAARQLVVTNAHVVAGATTLTVQTTDGTRHRATPIVVDHGADIAVLRVDDLTAAALPLATAAAPNGTSALVLGYPDDGPLTVTPAVVVQRLPLPQPGVGTSGLGIREVYRIRADVRHGNSGSPLLDTDGHVIGIVNTLSLLGAGTGFALTLDPARQDLTTATGLGTSASAGVSTRACAS